MTSCRGSPGEMGTQRQVTQGWLAGELAHGTAGCWGWLMHGVTFSRKKLLFIPEQISKPSIIQEELLCIQLAPWSYSKLPVS